MYKSNRLFSVLMQTAGLTALAMTASTARAQAPAAATASEATASGDEADFGEIIVTARKHAETAQHVGMAISVFGAKDLDRRQITSTDDITGIVPSFTAATSASGTPIYTLRGIGFQTVNMSSTSPVGIYVDDAPYSYPYLARDVVFDLERVEVLKGPQGTLYGRNTTGGLVNYITAKPTKTFKASLTAGYANYNAYELKGFLSGPVTPTLGVRVAFQVDGRGTGWQQSLSRAEKLGKAEHEAARINLQWEPDDKFSATFSGSYWRDHSDTQAAQAVAYVPLNVPNSQAVIGNSIPASLTSASQADWTPSDYPGAVGGLTRPPFRTDAEFYGTNLRLNYQLSDHLKLISQTSYSDVHRDSMVDNGGVAFEVLDYNNSGSIKSFSQEVRLDAEFGRSSLIVGANYGHDKLVDQQIGWALDSSSAASLRQLVLAMKNAPAGIFPPFAGAVTAPYTNAQILSGFRTYKDSLQESSTTWGVFVHAEQTLSDTLKANVGVRYTEDKQDFTGCTGDYQGNLIPVIGPFLSLLTLNPTILAAGSCSSLNAAVTGVVTDPFKDALKEHNFSARGGLEWSPTPTTLFYASVAQGYKAGVFPVLPANSVKQYQPAKQEKVVSYEIGTKNDFFDRKLQANFSAFYYDYTNKQLYGRIADPIFKTIPALVNVPKSSVYGFEGSLTLSPGNGFANSVSVGYLHTKIRQFSGYDTFGNAINFAGNKFAYSPEWTVSDNLTYDHELSGKIGVEASVEVQYQSGSFGTLDNDSRFAINARTLVNASIAVVDLNKTWKAKFWGKNIFNKYYWTSADKGNDIIARYAGMPRAYGISLTHNF